MAKKNTNTFQIPAILEGIGHLKDGSLSLRFHTQEMTDNEKLTLMGFFQSFGYLLFRANKFSDADIPKDDAKYDGKTPSQHLRACIYRYWEIVGSEDDFEVFYRRHIEKLADQYKGKMENITG